MYMYIIKDLLLYAQTCYESFVKSVSLQYVGQYRNFFFIILTKLTINVC